MSGAVKNARGSAAKRRRAVVVSLPELQALLAGAGNPPITKGRISQLVSEGMPKTGHGEYDALACMPWYIGRMRPQLLRRAKEDQAGVARNLTEERTRLIAAQADTAEMDRDERRGRLMPIELYEAQVAGWAGTIKARFLSLSRLWIAFCEACISEV